MIVLAVTAKGLPGMRIKFLRCGEFSEIPGTKQPPYQLIMFRTAVEKTCIYGLLSEYYYHSNLII
jgi:hypothetical protein